LTEYDMVEMQAWTNSKNDYETLYVATHQAQRTTLSYPKL